jgi:hypothetical protein
VQATAFASHYYAMEADSMGLIKILCSHYNKLRKGATKPKPRLTREELVKLAQVLETTLSAGPPASPSKLNALHFMGALLVAFLCFTLPQRAQVSFCHFNNR